MSTEQLTPAAYIARVLEASKDTYYQIPLNDLVADFPEEVRRARYYVLAEHYRCFSNWCNKVGISPRNPAIKYISGGYGLRGLNPNHTALVKVCRWGRKRQPGEIEDIRDQLSFLQSRGVPVVYDRC